MSKPFVLTGWQQDGIFPYLTHSHNTKSGSNFMFVIDIPGGGISVEMADNLLALLDLTEKVFLTWNFSVLTMAFSQ